LEPSISRRDDFVWVCFPYEWFSIVLIVFLDEAIDGGLEIDQ
jgi:hypothetical protein